MSISLHIIHTVHFTFVRYTYGMTYLPSYTSFSPVSYKIYFRYIQKNTAYGMTENTS